MNFVLKTMNCAFKMMSLMMNCVSKTDLVQWDLSECNVNIAAVTLLAEQVRTRSINRRHVYTAD